jgi:hypothetical protein
MAAHDTDQVPLRFAGFRPFFQNSKSPSGCQLIYPVDLLIDFAMRPAHDSHA